MSCVTHQALAPEPLGSSPELSQGPPRRGQDGDNGKISKHQESLHPFFLIKGCDQNIQY